MHPSTIAHQIDAYLDGPAQLRHVVADLSPQQLEARPVSGMWSTLEVVCHLVDSEQAWCHRMKRVIAEEKPLLIGYDESRFAALLGYHQHNLKTELALLEGMRLQMTVILRGLPEVAWARTGVHSERGLITLEEMLRAEVEHAFHHITRIIEKRRALGLPNVDPGPYMKMRQ
jgi:DinB superfamily